MAERARGTIADRPWGLTFGALGIKGLTGQLTLAAEGKLFCVAFDQGAVVGATSPLLNDAAVRVALTGGLVSSTQAAEISRRLAAAPTRDELDVIAESARLTPDQAQRLRRRVVAQRAARTFSVERGEFVVEDRITIPVLPGSELDIRAVIYLGARANLTEDRLAADLSALGAWFQIKPDTTADLPQYGFTEIEKPILEMLLAGANLVELETAHPELDARGVRAIVYALVSCGACEIGAQPRGNPRQPRLPTPPPTRATSTPPLGARTATRSSPPSAARTSTRSTPPTGTAVARTQSISKPGIDITPIPTRNNPGSSPPAAATPSGSRGSSPGPVAAAPSTPSGGVRVPGTPPDGMPSFDTRTPSGGIRVPAVSRGSSPGFPRARSEPPPGTEDVVRMKLPTGGPKMALKPLTEARAQRNSTNPPAARPRKNDTITLETEALIAEKAKQVDQGADHYTLLGIARTATPEQIRTAYFNLARKLHPDRLTSLGISDPKKDAQRVFAQINGAFAVLTDPAKVADYLDVLERGGEAVVRDEQARADEMATKLMLGEEAFKRGEMALRRNDVAQAVAEFQTACDLQPSEPEYQALLAWAKFCAAPDKNAIAPPTRIALTKAADASDKTVTARFYLGRVERMLGREKEALSHFQYVVLLKPNHTEAQAEVRVLESRLKGKR